MSTVLLKDLDEEKGIYERIDIAIGALRDEIAGAHFQRLRGQNRLLSLAVAKLDEAQGLAILFGKETGRIAVVDRAGILRIAQEDTTDTTVENSNGVANV